VGDAKSSNRGQPLDAISLPGESSSLTALLSVAGVLTLAMTAAAFYSFSQPLQVAETVDVPLHTHRSSFTYTVHTLPSTLDPDGVLGPVSPSPTEDVPEDLAPRIAFRAWRETWNSSSTTY
jgi:hypothetical protein